MGAATDSPARLLRQFVWLLRLILQQRTLRRLRSAIWPATPDRTHFRILLPFHEEYGTLNVHPLIALRYGISPGTPTRVQLWLDIESATNHQGGTTSSPLPPSVVTRIFRVYPDPSLYSLNECRISASDFFNLTVRKDQATKKIITVMSLFPLGRSLRRERSGSGGAGDAALLPLADRVRVGRIISASSVSSHALFDTLGKLFASGRIVKSGDVMRVITTDPFDCTESVSCIRIDCSPHTHCLVTERTSVYEIASMHALSPFGSQPLPLPLLAPSGERLLQTMRDVCVSHRKLMQSLLSNRSSLEPLVILLHGGPGCGRRLELRRLAAATHQNFLEVSCLDLWSDTAAQGEAKLRNAFERARAVRPCILYLSSVDALGYDAHSKTIDPRLLATLRGCLSDASEVTPVFGCRSNQLSSLSPSLRALCLYEYGIECLVESDRLSFLTQTFRRSGVVDHTAAQSLACQAARNTSGFSVAELNDLIVDARFNAFKDGGRSLLRWTDIERAIDKRNQSFADAIGAPKIPCVRWEDIGGLEETKRVLRESIEANLRGQSAHRLKRSGIILFGPPGCGKTLLAKAVSTEYKIAFLSVKGPELLNKYVGQSEENLRNVFERARQASPCIIFFDELDSIAPNRGRHGDSGGVMDRIVSQLLSELDELQARPATQVFVMAATNRADLLDPALLSPGRFDKVVNVAPGSDVESKTKILEAVSRSVRLADDVDMTEVAKSCDAVMSGAELYSIISNATMEAIREQVQLIEKGVLREADADIRVSQSHFMAAVSKGRYIS